jgi:3-isopropylmalate/(R)-2-methylmalate dehydratase small subunit
VQAGDILVAGRNFGMGSSRAAARSLRNLRLACAIAESINGLFLRNAVAFGFLALECPGIRGLVAEGQVAEVSLEDWSVRSRDSGATLPVVALPPGLLELMRGKGIYATLMERGYIGGLLGEKDRSAAAGR